MQILAAPILMVSPSVGPIAGPAIAPPVPVIALQGDRGGLVESFSDAFPDISADDPQAVPVAWVADPGGGAGFASRLSLDRAEEAWNSPDLPGGAPPTDPLAGPALSFSETDAAADMSELAAFPDVVGTPPVSLPEVKADQTRVPLLPSPLPTAPFATAASAPPPVAALPLRVPTPVAGTAIPPVEAEGASPELVGPGHSGPLPLAPRLGFPALEGPVPAPLATGSPPPKVLAPPLADGPEPLIPPGTAMGGSIGAAKAVLMPAIMDPRPVAQQAAESPPPRPEHLAAGQVRVWQGVFLTDPAEPPRSLDAGGLLRPVAPEGPPLPAPVSPGGGAAASPAAPTPAGGITAAEPRPPDDPHDAGPGGLLPAGLLWSGPAGPAGQIHTAGQTLPNLPQLASQITAALVSRPDGQVEISLSPDELGHLRLTLQPDSKDPDRVVVTLVFDRPDTLDLFRRNADQLADALRAAGYEAADLSFGHSGGQGPRTDHPAASGQDTGAADSGQTMTADASPSRGHAPDGTLDLRL
jgi:hypothetical protein